MAELFQRLCQALEFTESEHDEHADTIRDVLSKPEFNVNRRGNLRDSAHTVALHVACADAIRSPVGAQLLLSDERCDVNLQDVNGYTALMTAVRYVKSEDDKHAEIIRILLDHPSIDVNKKNKSGQTALHGSSFAHVGTELLLRDKRCESNLQDDSGNTALMAASTTIQSFYDGYGKSALLLMQ